MELCQDHVDFLVQLKCQRRWGHFIFPFIQTCLADILQKGWVITVSKHKAEGVKYCIGHCSLPLAGLYLIYVMFLEFCFCVQIVVITTILTIFLFIFSQLTFLMQRKCTSKVSVLFVYVCSFQYLEQFLVLTKCGMNVPSETNTTLYILISCNQY